MRRAVARSRTIDVLKRLAEKRVRIRGSLTANRLLPYLRLMMLKQQREWTRRCVFGATLLIACSTTLRAQEAEAAEDKTKWKSSATLGFTLNKGNSDNLMLAIRAATQKKWLQNELGFGAGLAYGEEQDSVTTSTIGAFGQYNRLFTEKFYGYGRLDFLHDGIAKVDYDFTLSPGAGYYFLNNDKFTLAGEVGPGVIWQRLDGVDSSYWTLRLGERFAYQISKGTRLYQTFEYLPQVDDFGNYLMNFEAGIETDIVKSLALSVAVLDNYRSRPSPGRKSNDIRLITGITYNF